MIRILHIISGDLWAGAEIMAYTLLKRLARYPDLDLHVIVLNNGKLLEELRDTGIALELVDEAKLSFIQISSGIFKTIRRLKPDIIHSHRYKENILASLCTLNWSGKQALIATQHGMPELFNSAGAMSYRMMWRINRWLLAKKFRHVVAVSEDIKTSFISEYGFSDERLKTIHNGIQLSEICGQKTDRSGVWMGSAGRFFLVKDYPFLVEIAKEVSAHEGNIFFRIAGDGPQFGEVESKIKDYGLMNRIFLSGFISEMTDFYRNLDVYINTSLHEGIPMSVLEAMSHGLPVIAPRVGGFKEIITNGIEGFLIEDRDPAAFAEKCILLATNEDLRTKMSLAAQKKVLSHFSAERMANQYFELYQSIIL
jgi:L-malate glycosyltransferase